MILALLSVFSVALFAENSSSASAPARTEGKWTDISYVNVPVLKILEGKDGYVIIPKKWAHGTPEAPRKLKFRAVKTSLGSYMTVVKDAGEFKRVILSIPMNKNNSIWGVVDSRKNLEGADKDTLEDLEF